MAYKIKTNLEAVNSGFPYAILVGKSETFEYENGKRAEAASGVKLNLALQGARFTQLNVKFEKDPLLDITDEAIGKACEQNRLIFVKPTDCEVNLYRSDNGIGMTATASGAEIITPPINK